MTTRQLSTRSHRALALEPRILLDAAAPASAEVVVDASSTNPGVKAKGVAATITIDETDGRQEVDLFSDIEVTLATTPEDLDFLKIRVNSTGSNQALEIHGETINLVTGSGTTANPEFIDYTVTVEGSDTIIRVDVLRKTPEQVASLIDSLAYVTMDNSVRTQNVTVSLDSLSDLSDTTELDTIHSTISITNSINVAPELSSAAALNPAEQFNAAATGTVSAVHYSSDGQFAYFMGANSISTYSVDTQGRLSLVGTLSEIRGPNDTNSDNNLRHLVLSGDGKSAYAIANDNTLVQFNVAANGTLTSPTPISMPNSARSTGNLALSSDGQSLYVGTYLNHFLVFSRDTDGALTYINQAPRPALGGDGRNAVIATAGDYVHAVASSNQALRTYSRNDDGTLTEVANLDISASGNAAIDFSMVTSADGQYVFLANPQTQTLLVYRFDSGSNQLTQLNSIPVTGISDVVMNSTGTRLYTSQRDGTLSTYSVASNGALSLLSSSTASASVNQISLSADGLSLLAVGSNVGRYTSVQPLSAGQASSFASGLTLSDSNYDALANGTGNYNGAKITVSASTSGGVFGLATGNNLTLSPDVINHNGNPIASLTRTGNNLTVTFNAAVTKEVANQVLKQLTYSHASAAPGTLIRLSVSSADQALPGNTLEIVLRANAGPQVDNTVAASNTLDKAITETPYNRVLPEDLFSDADGDALVWSVSGLPEGLTFNADTRTISGSPSVIDTLPRTFPVVVTVTDSSGASAQLTLNLEVEQIANRAPQADLAVPGTLPPATEGAAYSVVLDSALFTDADSIYGDTLTWEIISGLPQGLTFNAANRTISGTTTALGSHTITVRVTDEDGGTTQRDLTLRVITESETDNRAPVFSTESSSQTYIGRGKVTGSDYFVFDQELSPNDRTLVVMGNTGANAALVPTTNSSLYVYARDAVTGELTLLQTFTQGTSNDGNAANGIEINGLTGGTSVAWSGDGKYLYTVGKDSANNYVINALSANTDGTLSSTNLSTVLGTEQVTQIDVSADGKTLYAVSSNNVYSVQVGTDGTLTLAGTYTEVRTTSAIDIEVDRNGTVYVQSSGQLTLYRTTPDSTLVYLGRLTRSGTTLTYTDAGNATSAAGVLGSASGFSSMRDFTVSDSGTIYLVTGVANHVTALNYDRTNNRMALVTSFNANSQIGGQPWSAELSPDGRALYVGNSLLGFGVYRVNTDGSLVWAGTANESGGRGMRLAVSSDGTSIYTGGYAFAGGLGQVSVSNDLSVNYLEDSTLNLLNGLTLRDADYDALSSGAGNYKDAIVRLERTGGTADSNDTYDFTAGNNLSLVDGQIRLNDTAIATFNNANGALVLTFTGDVSTAVANQVLQGISYSYVTDNEPPASIALRLSVNDQYIGSSLNVRLNVIPVNDAPTLTATGAPTDLQEGGAAASLFSAVQISTIETNQSINRLTLTVTGVADGTNEILNVNNRAIALVTGRTTAGNFIYEVTLADGTATLVISNNSGITSGDAATLLQGLTYTNTSQDPTAGDREVTLTAVRDTGGTTNNGKDTTDLTDQNITATVTVIPVNDAPTLQATTRTAGHGSAGDNATLFENVQLSTVESSQTISNVTFTITGLRDGADENINLNGTRIALINGTSTTGDYSYRVTLNGGTATVVVTASSASAGIAASDAQTLIAGASYTHLSETASGGPRSFSLSVQDNGGTENTGIDTATLAGTTVLTVARNTAPQLSGGPDLSNLGVAGNLATVTGLDNLTASAMSPGGEHLYVVDNDGDLAILSRNAANGELRFVQNLDTSLTSASQVQISADGSRLYVLGNDGNSLVVYSRSGSDGSLTLSQPLTTANVVGLASSGDGAALYLINNTGLQVYNRDSNGQYSQGQSLPVSGDARLAGAVQVEAVNGFVYVVTAPTDANAVNTLIVYQAASNGQLSTVAALPDAQQSSGQSVVLDDAVDVAVSADGRTIFIASSTGVARVSFDASASSPSLSYSNPVTGLTNVTAVALSADADTLYVTSSDGSISRYKVEASALTLLQGITATEQPGLNGASQVLAAGNDAVLVTGSGGVVSLNDRLASQIPLTYTEKGSSILLAEALRLSDADSDELAGGAGNYKDTRITVSRQGTANSNDSYSLRASEGLSLADGVVSLQGNAIATFAVNQGTLTLSFTAEVSTATANAVLNNISYSNASSDPAATLNLILRFTDVNSSNADALLRLTVTTINDAPTLTSTAATRDFIRGAQAVSLFSDTAVSTVEAGQNISALTLTVSGLRDGESEVLSADGSDIALVAGGSGTTTSGYTYSVALNAGVATVTFSASLSGSAAAALVDGLTYRNSSAEATLGNRTVSLTVVQDDGGTDNGGSDTSNLSLSAGVTVRDTPPVTQPPVTQPPVTEPPVTQPPVTEPPVTEPPVTQPPVTEPPVTVPPVTQPPVTENPGTQPPVITPPVTPPTVVATPEPQPTVTIVRSQPIVADSTVMFGETLFEQGESETESSTATEQAEPVAASANAPVTAREARWTSTSGLTGAGETVTQQLVQADVLFSNSLSQPATSNFVFQGSTLVAQVDSLASSSRSVTLALPGQLPDGTVPSAISLASGLPLPNWVRFDASSGELQIDRAQLERLGSVRLILTSRDIDGQQIQTELRIDNAQQPNPRAEAPGRDAEAGDQARTDAQDASGPLRQSAANTLLDDARTLLESLSGLNAQPPAPARHTA